MSRTPLHRLRLAAVLATLILGVALLAGLRGRHSAPGAPGPTLATVYPAPQPLPEFVLVAQDGSRFDRARLEGHWTLLFLGFTQCADVCPATLATLAAARRALPAASRPAVVMVAVDPAHDTPAALAAYLLHFDPSFVGATGAEAALRSLASALGAYYAPAAGTTPVTHSGATYLIDPTARIAAVYTTLPAPLALAADFRRVTRAGGGA